MAPPRGRPQAIVGPAAGRAVFDVQRIEPATDLSHLVDYHWLVRWSDADGHVQRVVPQPVVHVAAEAGRLLVHGINRDAFERVLSGSGHVLGTAFRAGGFRPFLGRPLTSLAGKVLPASEVLGHDDRGVAERILASDDRQEVVAAMESYLRLADPGPDPTVDEVAMLVRVAEERREITRADQLADVAGLSLRSLQRLFAEYVGVGPKWVVRRFRLLDAAAAAHTRGTTDWASLAVELGFSDQSHLIRTFTAVVGSPPSTYERDPRTTG